jgi:septal ring factor EnvC (AmiA/AmiB activator)
MGSGPDLFVSLNNFLESWYGHLSVLELYCPGISSCKECGRHMSVMTEERQQIQLELEGLKRTLEWTEIQREQLLDRLDMLRLDNARLQDRVEELQRQVEGLKQQQPMF